MASAVGGGDDAGVAAVAGGVGGHRSWLVVEAVPGDVAALAFAGGERGDAVGVEGAVEDGELVHGGAQVLDAPLRVLAAADPVGGGRAELGGGERDFGGPGGDAVDVQGGGAAAEGHGQVRPLPRRQRRCAGDALFGVGAAGGDREARVRFVVARAHGQAHVRLGAGAEVEDLRAVRERGGVLVRVGQVFGVDGRELDPGGDRDLAQAVDEALGQREVLGVSEGRSAQADRGAAAALDAGRRLGRGGGQRGLAFGEAVHQVCEFAEVGLVARAGVGLGEHAQEVAAVVASEVAGGVVPAAGR